MTDSLVELDSLEILAIVDNELDPISPCPNPTIQYSGGMKDIAARSPLPQSNSRDNAAFEFKMDNICCSAHGLSLMITGVKGDQRHTILFDTGPTEDIWRRNAERLRADIGRIEVVHLSHWHRDHSGGMLKVLEMVDTARKVQDYDLPPLRVDLHPARPDYRGIQPPNGPVVSMEADPTFEEIERLKGVVDKHDQPHTVLDNMFLISGEIPRVTEYEKGLRSGVRFDAQSGKWEADEIMADERLLMCKIKNKGIVMFTGCSHAGVVNATRHALDLDTPSGDKTDATPLYAVMGGFHLADAGPELIRNTVDDLTALQPELLIAGHCTGWRAKFELQVKVPGRFVPCFVGSRFVL